MKNKNLVEVLDRPTVTSIWQDVAKIPVFFLLGVLVIYSVSLSEKIELNGFFAYVGYIILWLMVPVGVGLMIISVGRAFAWCMFGLIDLELKPFPLVAGQPAELCFLFKRVEPSKISELELTLAVLKNAGMTTLDDPLVEPLKDFKILGDQVVFSTRLPEVVPFYGRKGYGNYHAILNIRFGFLRFQRRYIFLINQAS